MLPSYNGTQDRPIKLSSESMINEPNEPLSNQKDPRSTKSEQKEGQLEPKPELKLGTTPIMLNKKRLASEVQSSGDQSQTKKMNKIKYVDEDSSDDVE